MSGMLSSRAFRTVTVLVALGAALTAWTAAGVVTASPAIAHEVPNYFHPLPIAGTPRTTSAPDLPPNEVYGVEASISVGASVGPVGVAYDSANHDVYVTDSQGNELSVISTTSETVTGTIPVGFFPVAIAYDSSNSKLYVADFAQNSISVVSTATGRVVGNISVGVGPDAVAFDNLSGNIFVANEGSNNTTVITGATDTVSGSVPVGVNPVAIAYDYVDNEVFVANENSSNVSVIAAADDLVVGQIPVGQEPLGLAFDNATDSLYVANEESDNTTVIDTVNDAAITSVSVGTRPVGVAYDSALGVIVVANDGSNDTTLIFGSNNSVAASVGVGIRPVGVTYAADNGYAYVTNAKSGNVSVIGTPTVPPYAVEFAESGLPSGTSWTVTLQGSAQPSTGPTDTFDKSNGSYSYTIAPIANFSLSPSSGTAIVAGFPLLVNVTFTLVRYVVNFTESGLPAGALWTVTLGATGYSSSTASAVIQLSNGSFQYNISSLSGYSVSPASGWANVSGSNLAIAVTFTSSSSTPHSSSLGGIPLWEIAVIIAAIAAVVVAVLLSMRRARPPSATTSAQPLASPPPTGPGTP
jgi:YVTN family beta-propeller protein